MSNSLDIKEIEKFSDLAKYWWDEQGAFKELHEMNPLRLRYIRDNIYKYFSVTDLKDTKILDIGCGGGILSEPLARMGANVTAIDASDQAIRVAQEHAQESGLNIEYICSNAEELADSKRVFDVVLCMEIVEHVADLHSFITAAGALVKPGGMLFISTINRTIKSYATAIMAAEYVLRMVPVGTHEWKKFVKPSEISDALRAGAMNIEEIVGCSYNPLSGSRWKISENIDVNYMLYATK